MTTIAKLQREHMELHQQSIHNADGTYDWAIGILTNLPKCHKQLEVTEHGANMTQTQGAKSNNTTTAMNDAEVLVTIQASHT